MTLNFSCCLSYLYSVRLELLLYLKYTIEMTEKYYSGKKNKLRSYSSIFGFFLYNKLCRNFKEIILTVLAICILSTYGT